MEEYSSKEQRYIIYYERYKEGYELKPIVVCSLLSFPYLWIKTKYEKVYSSFNFLPILTEANYGGYANE